MKCGAFAWLLTVVIGCGGELVDPGPGGGGAGGVASDGGGTDGGGGSGPKQPDDGLPLLGSDCDPMVPEHCGLPFPSNVYLLDDPDEKNPSGKSVRFGATSLPTRKKDGVHITPDMFFDVDGFSPAGAAMTFLPRATAYGAATPYDIERSLEDDSPTILIEAETGRHVPHWLDLDVSNDHEDQRLLMVRPAERLRDGTRYIVALRSIVDGRGDTIEPSTVFAALRAGEVLTEGSEAEVWTTYARKELYEDIFSKLDDAGVPRDDLQIAWDFTTASKEGNTSRMLKMRDLALEEVGEEGPSFVVTNVEEFPTVADNPYLLRRVEVKITVPLYLTSDQTTFGADEPYAYLHYDEDGALVQNGTMEMDVLIHVPRSVLSGAKHGLLQNGHGLFGSRNEGRNGFFAKTTNRDHYIGFSMNFFGFDEDAEGMATQILFGRFDGFKSLTERQIQGMVNQLLGMRMMLGRVRGDGDSGRKRRCADRSCVDRSRGTRLSRRQSGRHHGRHVHGGLHGRDAWRAGRAGNVV